MPVPKSLIAQETGRLGRKAAGSAGPGRPGHLPFLARSLLRSPYME